MMPRLIVDLFNILPEIDVDFENYVKSEQEVIEPALRKKGYKLITPFQTGERDSFGPLSRYIIVTTPQGNRAQIVYG